MTELPPFQQRAEDLLARVFRGIHHVHSLKKALNYWTCIHAGSLASFDFDELTRLVLAAHEYCVRVDVSNGGPNRLKIMVSDRKRESESIYDRHPTIEQALEKWNSHTR